MMNYNYPYYPRLVGAAGFRKEVDFVSCYLDSAKFHLPERVRAIAERARQRSNLVVRTFGSGRELQQWGKRVGQAYNAAFVRNWEFYPLTERELDFMIGTVIAVANPRLMKIITHDEQVVGFLFAFPDLSAALQRARGHLLPFAIFDLLLEMRRTHWVAINGAGILPEYQGRGGNALLYLEIEKSVRDSDFQHADLTQVAETAVQMRHDLENLGGRPYKNHRVYIRDLP
jgi:hypothetical protein